MIKKEKWLQVSKERAQAVVEEIYYGSIPKFSFYALLLTSSLIASIGLILNSTAVIIGAMLVSPLMTPILGIALALVRGETGLLGKALLAEFAGIFLAVAIAALFGLLPLGFEATPEMLARTNPNLLDLLVAVFAGFAGAYAMIDERISPALPGVAIATAIVPPLSNTGLCIALGAYHGAMGSFLLFVANFFSILLVASIIFAFAGLSPRGQARWEYSKRFGLAVIGFLLVAGFLTQSLVKIVHDRTVTSQINSVITEYLNQYYGTTLESEVHEEMNNKLFILATVLTPKIITPDKIAKIQEQLSNKTKIPTELIIRNTLSKDMTAHGSTGQITSQNLNGIFLKKKLSEKEYKTHMAEQVLWTVIAKRPDYRLLSVEYVIAMKGPVILVTLEGFRAPNENEIRFAEKKIRNRLGDPDIELVAKFHEAKAITRHGEAMWGWSADDSSSPEKNELIKQIDDAIQAEFNKIPNLYPLNTFYDTLNTSWDIMVDVVGTRIMTPEEQVLLEKEVAKQTSQPLQIHVRTRTDVAISNGKYIPFDMLVEKKRETIESRFLEHWNK